VTDHDVLVIGGAGVDTVVQVPDLPVPFADSVHVPPIREYVAHTGNGVALGSRALGLRVKMVDYLGDDELGALIRARLEAAGVDASWLLSTAGTRRSVNLVDDRGRRMSFYDGRESPGQRMSADFVRPFLAASRHVHISIMDYARHLYPEVHRHGISVSTDLHDWDGENDHQRDFAYGSDLVFLSAAALEGRVYATMRDILERGQAQVVVATAGERGGHVLTRDGGEIRDFSPVRGPVVDSNGAGDAFVSGFLYGWLAARPVAECVRYGAVSGFYACGAAGTHQALITAEELIAKAA
jgi:sugar/nucleoside kinase (ribokinase family)